MLAHHRADRTLHNSGLLDLEHEIARLTVHELVDQVSCLIESPDWLRPFIANRLHLATSELRRRLTEGERAA